LRATDFVLVSGYNIIGGGGAGVGLQFSFCKNTISQFPSVLTHIRRTGLNTLG